MNKQYFILISLIVFLLACNNEKTKSNETEKTNNNIIMKDLHSFSNPEQAKISHLNLSIKVDFDTKTIHGKAQYRILNNNATEIIFDIKGLTINKVVSGYEEKEVSFTISEPIEHLGSALKVSIEPTTEIVSIYYNTEKSKSEALQWLEPQQTYDKKHPFLFTQGQAILTRTWIPIQDSPGIRITYHSRVEIPKNLMAVMSAANPISKNEFGVYEFAMDNPIPPYLIALAVGDLQYATFSNRTGVYAEPGLLEKAAYEFADTEKMVQAAEKLYGKYVWGKYDIIVLPPSFPFGGMENPVLTFATPTIIAGDRSLTALIAHELAHSWSGNLVTNATWDDFWLNEGFTVYFERRIIEELYGKDYSEMLALLGHQDLIAEEQALVEDYDITKLKINLEGRNPDDGMTDIAYEKGYFFLRLLEETAGREQFDLFLKNYFSEHAFQTITTEQFLEYLNEKLISPLSLNVNVDEWVYSTGIPKNCPKIESKAFTLVETELQKWIKEGSLNIEKTKNWSSHEWLHFIRTIPSEISIDQLKSLDELCQFSNSQNSEIVAAWFETCLNHKYHYCLPQIKTFLTQVGRRKFLVPIYSALLNNGFEQEAKDIYTEARKNYHSVSTNTLDKLLIKS